MVETYKKAIISMESLAEVLRLEVGKLDRLSDYDKEQVDKAIDIILQQLSYIAGKDKLMCPYKPIHWLLPSWFDYCPECGEEIEREFLHS